MCAGWTLQAVATCSPSLTVLPWVDSYTCGRRQPLQMACHSLLPTLAHPDVPVPTAKAEPWDSSWVQRSGGGEWSGPACSPRPIHKVSRRCGPTHTDRPHPNLPATDSHCHAAGSTTAGIKIPLENGVVLIINNLMFAASLVECLVCRKVQVSCSNIVCSLSIWGPTGCQVLGPV